MYGGEISSGDMSGLLGNTSGCVVSRLNQIKIKKGTRV